MKFLIKTLMAGLVMCATASVTAQKEAPKQFAAGAHVGTLGLGVHAHYQPSYLVSGTAYLETIKVSVEQRQAIENDPSSLLKADSNIFTGSANLNLHPFLNGFRVSGGLTLGKPELSGTSTYDSNDVSNNDGTIAYTIEAEKGVQPYLGIGYSAYRGGDNRLYFHGDVGALFVGKYSGSATANLNCSSKPTLAEQTACQTEQGIVQNQANNEAQEAANELPEIYPVVRVGIGIKF